MHSRQYPAAQTGTPFKVSPSALNAPMAEHRTQWNVTHWDNNTGSARFDRPFPLLPIRFNFYLRGLSVAWGLMPNGVGDEEVGAFGSQHLHHALQPEASRPHKGRVAGSFMLAIRLPEQADTVGTCTINRRHDALVHPRLLATTPQTPWGQPPSCR